MKPQAKVIKAVKFEDGTYTIHAAPQAFVPTDVTGVPVAPVPGVDPAVALEAVQREAKALVEQAQAEADFALKLASEEAAAIRQQALLDAEQLVAEAGRAAEAKGYETGLEAGRAAGYEAVQAQYARQLAELMAGAEAATYQRQRLFAENEKDMVKLALLVAQKILLTELVISRDSVLKLSAAALKRINDKTAVRLRVHPDDEALVLKAKGPLMLGVDNLTSLEVLPDPGVGLGGCVVETRTGIVDARVATQLAEVATTLLELPMGDEQDLDPVVLQAIRALKGGSAGLPAEVERAAAWEDDYMPALRPAAPMAPIPIPAAALQAPAAPLLPVNPPVEEVALPAAEPAPPLAEEAPVPEAPAVEAEVEAVVPPEAVTQALARMTDEEVHALTQALSELVPPDEPEAPEAFERKTLGRRAPDPSKRAAEALAARLGQLKKGRGVARMQEEYDMSLLDGALGDAELEAIVRGVLRKAPGQETEIALEQKLVHDPTNVDAAADALAERLGLKKKPKRNWYDGVESLSQDGPTEQEIAELASALDDSRIDQIMTQVVPHVPAPGSEPEAQKPADLAAATDNLAKLLGKNKKKSNRPWYDGLE